jgi:hypothetical protein
VTGESRNVGCMCGISGSRPASVLSRDG